MLRADSDRVPRGLDRYVLQRILSQGGFGVVCEAWDELLQRPVAVKLTRAASGTAGLLEEAIYQASVMHPNVLGVLDAGVDGETTFVVMERIEGSDADIASLSPNVSAKHVRRWVADVALGLAALHERGLVHGDISPRNVIVGRDGRARLIDFGSCRPALGGAVATPGFVAPEGPGTVAADVYSLGEMLRWLLLRVGSDGDDPVVRRATARDPGRRHGSASEFASAVRPRRRRRWVGAAALAVGTGLLITPTVRDRVANADVARAEEIATRARAHLREGDLTDAQRVARELRTLAARSEHPDVRARALLLEANLADAEGRGREAIELRRRASVAAQGGVDAQTRVDTLAAQALDVSPEAAGTMLELADGAAREPDQRSFVAAIRAIVDASDPEIELPEAAGPYAEFIRFAYALRRLEHPAPDEPVPIDCAAIAETYFRGVCFSISAGVALQEENLEQAVADATTSISLIETSERDPCETQLAYVVRGVAKLDDDTEASEADLSRAMTLACTDDPPDDLAVIGLMHARALLRLGRTAEADALADKARPFSERPDVAEGLSVYEKERTSR
ncbi:MAG: serine/threonine protein kinase [Nannocystaceae bacterium]|nr:serine/threonine protein kinase [bacterium]